MNETSFTLGESGLRCDSDFVTDSGLYIVREMPSGNGAFKVSPVLLGLKPLENGIYISRDKVKRVYELSESEDTPVEKSPYMQFLSALEARNVDKAIELADKLVDTGYYTPKDIEEISAEYGLPLLWLIDFGITA